MDPELEAFIPLFPKADLSDPVKERKALAELAAAVPAPDTANLEIEDRLVPADPDVPVRIYRPHQAQGAIVWLHGGGFVMGDLDTEHPWAARLADGFGVVVISVGYRLALEHRFPGALDEASRCWPRLASASMPVTARNRGWLAAHGGHLSGPQERRVGAAAAGGRRRGAQPAVAA